MYKLTETEAPLDYIHHLLEVFSFVVLIQDSSRMETRGHT